ncbi:MAG: Glutamate--tRNA ligase [Phycisphaerae bacterium]|nr:Glutamate--tRNA ligase [Phycisphaerae bacterium]
MTATVRTRFAPSPTGYLHIGGARTALFNYLLARRSGGKFALRIEDTDQTRNIAGAEQKLLDDLRWLGLHWDEGPGVGGPAGEYHQSRRLASYQRVARELLDSGKAYYATETREELEAMRRAAQKEQGGFLYRRPTHFPSESEAQKARDEGRPVVVRLKMPPRDVVVSDQILGEVRIAASELYDFVLLKADGWPTYHFAVVVDDEAMGVTHVLRGQEHLMNTPNHIALQEALGYRTPVYAHLPIIMNMDGSKMSKREKDRAVRAAAAARLAAGGGERAALAAAASADPGSFEAWLTGDAQLDGDALRRLARELHVQLPEIEIHDFRLSGYLPETLLNFIALLGWSPGDGRERMSLEEMTAAFSVERIGKTNARFDRAKLLNFNTQAIAAAPKERLLAALRDYLGVSERSPLAGVPDDTLRRLLEINDGLRLFRQLEEKCAALFAPDEALSYDDDAVQKTLIKGERAGLHVLAELQPVLAAVGDWRAAALETAIKGFGESRGLGLGKVAQPIRVAVCGNTVSPPIFDTLELIGRERVLRRIGETLRRLAADAPRAAPPASQGSSS